MEKKKKKKKRRKRATCGARSRHPLRTAASRVAVISDVRTKLQHQSSQHTHMVGRSQKYLNEGGVGIFWKKNFPPKKLFWIKLFLPPWKNGEEIWIFWDLTDSPPLNGANQSERLAVRNCSENWKSELGCFGSGKKIQNWHVRTLDVQVNIFQRNGRTGGGC